MFSIQDITKDYYGVYYRIHDRDRGKWYFDEWFLVCLVKWLVDAGYDYEKYK